MDKNIEHIISLLQQEKPLPVEYQELLFPVYNSECELTYKGKVAKERILSVSEEPNSVPFQVDRVFGNSDADWKNLLIFGDNLQVLKTLNENKDPLIANKIKGKVKLIYIDPPFATLEDFGNKEGAKAYSDKVKGAEFIEFLRQRLILAREILSDEGAIYIHLDWRKVHYVKVICDEIFGENNFLNEVIWCYSEREAAQDRFNKKHDTILFYAKNATNKNRIFNCWDIALPYSEGSIKKYNLCDEKGRRYQIRGKGGHLIGKQQLKVEDEMNYPDWTYRDYLDEKKGILPRDWFADISFENRASNDRTNYPTQKPTKLLERIIKVSSNENDIVMDFFAGSGTTLAVAEKLKRRWIGVDIGKLSLYTIQKRLLTLPIMTPFAVVNAGCYDLKKVFEMEKQKYLDFVCELFHVEKQTKTINGITVDGKRRGDWVKIYEWQEFEEHHTAVDCAFIDALHKNIGDKIGSRFYIIAPEMNVDIIGDYYRPNGSNTRYYLLKIPYQFIKDLHKIDFKKLNQPRNKAKINSIENSVGFYFNETPEIKSHIVKNDQEITVIIDSCESPFIQQEKDILAMVMIDGSGGSDFIMQEYYFADDIKNTATGEYSFTIPMSALKTNNLKVIYVDIYGNEFKEVFEV